MWMTLAGKLREEAAMTDAAYDPVADRPIAPSGRSAVPAE
jgi:cytochrome c oxidase cbb3-type subunit I